MLILGFLLLCIFAGGVLFVAIRSEDRNYGWLWWFPVAYLVVTGTFAIVYSGYREDGDSPTAETWPLGAVSFSLAAIMVWAALRKRPPGALIAAPIIVAWVALVLWTWLPRASESL